MNNEIVKFEFNGQAIDFEPSKTNVMVNATQMANVFGKLPKDFLKNDTTKEFIKSCLKKENSPFLGINEEEDLIVSKQKSGTWMHRILALKFAAWLNPDFEVWVYATIEQILFGDANSRKQILNRKAEIKAEKEKLINSLSENEDFKKLQMLQAEEMRIGKDIAASDREAISRQYLLLLPDN